MKNNFEMTIRIGWDRDKTKGDQIRWVLVTTTTCDDGSQITDMEIYNDYKDATARARHFSPDWIDDNAA